MLRNTNPFSGAGIIPFFEIKLARHADLHQNGGFFNSEQGEGLNVAILQHTREKCGGVSAAFDSESFIGAISEFTLMTVAQSIEQRRAKSQVGGTNRSPLSRENGFTTDYIALFYMSHLPIEGFSLYPVSSKRESRYNEECVTENIAPGIVNHWIISVRKKADVSSVVRSSNLLSNVRAHLALHRSGVLCKGALFLCWLYGHPPAYS